tara:strand:+ start:412 stop:708 length:297 start_codon:yes stop_codon:yes gene_type:complete
MNWKQIDKSIDPWRDALCKEVEKLDKIDQVDYTYFEATNSIDILVKVNGETCLIKIGQAIEKHLPTDVETLGECCYRVMEGDQINPAKWINFSRVQLR